jgi:hypothetical protein
MKPLLWMVGAGLLIWLVATTLLGSQASQVSLAETGLGVALGVIGPLVATCGSWVLIVRTMRRDPTQVTALMMKSFAAKLLFFGLYVVLVVTVLKLRPVPFVVSFTSAFITLYLIEAFYLQRLFAEGLRASRS